MQTPNTSFRKRWVTCEQTGSRAVALRHAKGDKCIPIEPGYERLEVLVLFPKEHHKMHDVVIWDCKVVHASRKSAMEALM